jgi:hypothetical protein
MSARLREGIALADDDRHELVPRLDELPGALVLEPSREEVDVDTGGGEARKDVLTVAAVQGQRLIDGAVIGERVQGGLGHGVHREGRGKRLDVEAVGCLGSLVPVLAQSSRCGRAPALSARCQGQISRTPGRSLEFPRRRARISYILERAKPLSACHTRRGL